MTKILKSDLFRVYEGTQLLSEDSLLLTKLYLPLIGSYAFSLYHLLKEYVVSDALNNDDHQIKSLYYHLYSINESQFDEAIHLLEATSLLRTFVESKGRIKQFHFVLYPPKSLRNFLEDQSLTPLLINRIGQKQVQRMIDDRINRMDYLNYKEVSSPFNQVFNIRQENPTLKNIDRLISENTIKNIELDLDLLFAILKEENIFISMFTIEELEQVKHHYVIYPLEISDFARILIEAIVINALFGHRIDFDQLNKKLSFFESANKTAKKNPHHFELSGNSSYVRIANFFNKTNPIKFLEQLQKGTALNSSDRKLIDELLKMGLSNGAINALLDYVLKEQNNTLPKSYVTKIAGSLLRNNVSDALSAIQLLRKANSKEEQPEQSLTKITKEEAKKLFEDL